MDWHTRTEELQSRFFRTGSRACLWIDKMGKSVDPSVLTWTFTFMDLGMCHTISGHARVVKSDDGAILVNDVRYPNEDAALEAVFADHYQKFLNHFYRQMRLFV
jgi:hypothetical protein